MTQDTGLKMLGFGLGASVASLAICLYTQSPAGIFGSGFLSFCFLLACLEN